MKNAPPEIVPVKALRAGLSGYLTAAEERGRSIIISRGKGRGRPPDHPAALVPAWVVQSGAHLLDNDLDFVLGELLALNAGGRALSPQVVKRAKRIRARLRKGTEKERT